MPTTALPVARFFMRNTDLAQDASDNSLLPALFTEVSSRLAYYKINISQVSLSISSYRLINGKLSGNMVRGEMRRDI